VDKIIDHLRNVKFDLNIDCFTKSDLPYIQPEVLQFSVNSPMNGPLIMNEDKYQDLYISMILETFRQSVSKSILKHVFTFGRKSFIDLGSRFGQSATLYQNQSSKSLKIAYDLILKKRKYAIGNGRISSEYIMDSLGFYNSPLNSRTSNGSVYKIGRLSEIDFWIDPFMRWNDNFILLFDDVRVDISNFNFNINHTTSIIPRLIVSLDLKFDVINPEALFIFEDDYMDHWSEYKQEDRDKKIDYILDGTKESGSNSQLGIYPNDKLES